MTKVLFKKNEEDRKDSGFDFYMRLKNKIFDLMRILYLLCAKKEYVRRHGRYLLKTKRYIVVSYIYDMKNEFGSICIYNSNNFSGDSFSISGFGSDSDPIMFKFVLKFFKKRYIQDEKNDTNFHFI